MNEDRVRRSCTRPLVHAGAVVLAAVVAITATACADGRYAAPDRTVAFDEIIGAAGTTQALALDAEWYEQAARDVAAVTGWDADDPSAYLDGGRPDPDTVDFLVVCAWVGAASAGELPDDDAARLLERTGDDGCAGLSTEALSVAVGQLAPIDDEDERAMLLDRVTLKRAIYDALGPEIAEAVAG